MCGSCRAVHFVDRVLTLAGRDDFHCDIERWKYQRIDTTVISDGVACFFLATQGRFHRLLYFVCSSFHKLILPLVSFPFRGRARSSSFISLQ